MPNSSYLSQMRLDGDAIVVLGAGAGIGAACCRALAEAGASLLCVDNDSVRADAIADAVKGKSLAYDVTDRPAMEAVFAAAIEAFGPRVRGLVDVVGIAQIGPLENMDDVGFDKQYDMVLRHAFLAIQIGAPIIAANGGGAMTFIGSISGIQSIAGQAIYCSAKAALHHLVRCAAHEFGPRGVRINAVAPGYTRTPRLVEKFDQAHWQAVRATVPLRRPGSVEDTAGAVLFLQSRLADFMTGNVLTVDGGASLAAATPAAYAAGDAI